MTHIDPAVEHPIFGKRVDPLPTPTPDNPRPLVPQAWQSMDTAPMDGTIIIASGHYEPDGAGLIMSAMAVRYKDGHWWRENQGYGMTVTCIPSRWIPMPD